MTHSTHSKDAASLREEAIAWFVRRRDAEWSREDEDAFRQWLSADARHEDMYAHCAEEWAALDAMPADLVSRLRSAPSQLAVRPRSSLPRAAHATRNSLRRSAAVACLVMLVGGSGFLAWRHVQNEPTFVASFHTKRGQISEVPLPDGTVLTLDTATKIEVTYHRHHRQVKLLDGQAFFRVRHDTGSPFDVLAGAVRVTVVGTRFAVRNTRSMPASDNVQVAVEEGRVRVAPVEEETDAASGSEAILLTAGQQVVTTNAGTPGSVSSLAVADIAPWRGRQVSFIDTPLGDALSELERYHSTGLVVHDTSVAELRLSGTFDPMEAEALRRVLPRILPVRLKPVPDGGTEILFSRSRQ